MSNGWVDAKTLSMEGLRVTLSAPVCVGRSRDYFWFPQLVRRGNGDLLALISPYADEHRKDPPGLCAWSTDDGLSWSEPVEYRPISCSQVHRSSGELLLLPYYMKPLPDGMGAAANLIPEGRREIQPLPDAVRVTNWPKPDLSYSTDLGLAGFVFNGQVVGTRDGGYLATLYGRFEGDTRYTLVAAASQDGLEWNIRSVIAGADCALEGREGPSESAACRLADGRILCVFRLAGWRPFGQCWSEDEGNSWTDPVSMVDVHSVEPSLAVLPNGTMALSGGRPGICLWLDRDGRGDRWQRVDIREHHTTCHPREPVPCARETGEKRTSSYTEVVALDETHLLMIYDRIPNGWQPIPDDMHDMNSVWVCRITVERTAS